VFEFKMNQPPDPGIATIETDLGLKRMRDAFLLARQLHPDLFRESSFVLAGRPVRMRIVGQRLADLLELPFAHLRTANNSPPPGGLTIDLWDQSETTVVCHMGSSRHDLDLHPILKHSPNHCYASYQLQHTFICLDQRSAHMVGCASNAEQLSLYERGRPLHVPLSLWHKAQDIPLVHAALVAKNGRGLLLAGPGGSGKSTSALLSACVGFDFLSDDLVALEASNGGFVGHSLYSSTFMEPEDLKKFPLFADHALACRYPFERKHLVLLPLVPALRLARDCGICAVVLPRVLHLASTRLRPATRSEALMALAPSSLLVGERSHGRETFAKLGKLVEKVPCYWLELGGELDEVPRALDRLLLEGSDR
jgi:hypothetical protein